MSWFWRQIILINVLVIAFTISCKNKSDQPGAEVGIPTDFLEFYDRFHEDSLFQMEHIIFPLAGVPAYDSLRSEDWAWQQDNWKIHHTFDDRGGTFNRNWYNVNSVIIEKISDNSKRFTMERRWVKMGDDWHLIYYKEMGI